MCYVMVLGGVRARCVVSCVGAWWWLGRRRWIWRRVGRGRRCGTCCFVGPSAGCGMLYSPFLLWYGEESKREAYKVVESICSICCIVGNGLLELGEKTLWPISTSGTIRS